MESLLSSVNYWFVENPTVKHFQWRKGETFGSSFQFLNLTVLTYLSLTFLLRRRLSLSPSFLRPISAFHNLILLLLSLSMAIGVTLSSLSQMENNPKWLICFPKSQTPTGPVFFWAYVFYLSKILEFVDTVLIIMAGSDPRRLSFLHVYHHSVVVVMCYVWLSTAQSLVPIALATNASVHVVMYGYYFACAIGRRPRWKRAVTDCQIVQFAFSFAISIVMVYYHFTGNGCSGIWGWCFNAVFNASLLALFVDFHSKNYAMKKMKMKMKQSREGEDKRS